MQAHIRHRSRTHTKQFIEQKIIFQHTELMNASHSTNLFTSSCDHTSTNGKAPLHFYMNLQHPTIPLLALTRG